MSQQESQCLYGGQVKLISLLFTVICIRIFVVITYSYHTRHLVSKKLQLYIKEKKAILFSFLFFQCDQCDHRLHRSHYNNLSLSFVARAA